MSRYCFFLFLFVTTAAFSWGQDLLFKPSVLQENRLERREKSFSAWMTSEERSLYRAQMGGTGLTTLYVESNEQRQRRFITTSELRYATKVHSFKTLDQLKTYHAIYTEQEYELLSLSTMAIKDSLLYNVVWVKEDHAKDAKKFLKKLGIGLAEVVKVKE